VTHHIETLSRRVKCGTDDRGSLQATEFLSLRVVHVASLPIRTGEHLGAARTGHLVVKAIQIGYRPQFLGCEVVDFERSGTNVPLRDCGKPPITARRDNGVHVDSPHFLDAVCRRHEPPQPDGARTREGHGEEYGIVGSNAKVVDARFHGIGGEPNLVYAEVLQRNPVDEVPSHRRNGQIVAVRRDVAGTDITWQVNGLQNRSLPRVDDDQLLAGGDVESLPHIIERAVLCAQYLEELSPSAIRQVGTGCGTRQHGCDDGNRKTRRSCDISE